MMKPDLSPAVRKFLKQISRKLNLPAEMKQRICSDMETSICAKLEAGIPEAQILAELGRPADIAAEFNEQLGAHSYKKSPLRFACLAAAIFSAVMLIFKFVISFMITDLINGHVRSLGIIGGADGPTSIFVTASVSEGFDSGLAVWLLILILGIVGYYWFSRRSRKEDET